MKRQSLYECHVILAIMACFGTGAGQEQDMKYSILILNLSKIVVSNYVSIMAQKCDVVLLNYRVLLKNTFQDLLWND